MNFDKKLAVTISGTVCLLTTMMAPVSAAMFNFSYTGTSILNPNDTVTASGTLTTNPYDSATNSYEIIDITGTRNGSPIESLLSPDSFAYNDNLLFADGDSLVLNDLGFSYTAGGGLYNVANSYQYVETGYQGTDIGSPSFQPVTTAYPLTFSITLIPESSLMLGILSVTVLVAINKINRKLTLKKLNHPNESVAD